LSDQVVHVTTKLIFFNLKFVEERFDNLFYCPVGSEEVPDAGPYSIQPVVRPSGEVQEDSLSRQIAKNNIVRNVKVHGKTLFGEYSRYL